MKRTQVYITEEQDKRLADLARSMHVSKAEALRWALDRALTTDNAEDEAPAAIRASAGVFADHHDWPEWQRRVRGRTAVERLEDYFAR